MDNSRLNTKEIIKVTSKRQCHIDEHKVILWQIALNEASNGARFHNSGISLCRNGASYLRWRSCTCDQARGRPCSRAALKCLTSAASASARAPSQNKLRGSTCKPSDVRMTPRAPQREGARMGARMGAKMEVARLVGSRYLSRPSFETPAERAAGLHPGNKTRNPPLERRRDSAPVV